MHDPQTQAHQIKYPWGRRVQWMKDGLYHDPFITIWHVDPETDGSDDSCGWSYPKLTDKQKRRIDVLAGSESQKPYFLRQTREHWTGSRYEAEALYRGLLLLVADRLEIPLTFDEAARMAARNMHDTVHGDTADLFCFLPGYHSNFKIDDPKYRRQHFEGILYNVAGNLLRYRRPWYRHPRWHLWHWKIQIHPLQHLKRWLFTRCAGCGKRFAWGYAPVSRQWHSTKVPWYRGVPGLWHPQCERKDSERRKREATKELQPTED